MSDRLGMSWFSGVQRQYGADCSPEMLPKTGRTKDLSKIFGDLSGNVLQSGATMEMEYNVFQKVTAALSLFYADGEDNGGKINVACRGGSQLCVGKIFESKSNKFGWTDVVVILDRRYFFGTAENAPYVFYFEIKNQEDLKASDLLGFPEFQSPDEVFQFLFNSSSSEDSHVKQIYGNLIPEGNSMDYVKYSVGFRKLWIEKLLGYCSKIINGQPGDQDIDFVTRVVRQIQREVRNGGIELKEGDVSALCALQACIERREMQPKILSERKVLSSACFQSTIDGKPFARAHPISSFNSKQYIIDLMNCDPSNADGIKSTLKAMGKLAEDLNDCESKAYLLDDGNQRYGRQLFYRTLLALALRFSDGMKPISCFHSTELEFKEMINMRKCVDSISGLITEEEYALFCLMLKAYCGIALCGSDLEKLKSLAKSGTLWSRLSCAAKNLGEASLYGSKECIESLDEIGDVSRFVVSLAPIISQDFHDVIFHCPYADENLDLEELAKIQIKNILASRLLGSSGSQWLEEQARVLRNKNLLMQLLARDFLRTVGNVIDTDYVPNEEGFQDLTEHKVFNHRIPELPFHESLRPPQISEAQALDLEDVPTGVIRLLEDVIVDVAIFQGGVPPRMADTSPKFVAWINKLEELLGKMEEKSANFPSEKWELILEKTKQLYSAIYAASTNTPDGRPDIFSIVRVSHAVGLVESSHARMVIANVQKNQRGHFPAIQPGETVAQCKERLTELIYGKSNTLLERRKFLAQFLHGYENTGKGSLCLDETMALHVMQCDVVGQELNGIFEAFKELGDVANARNAEFSGTIVSIDDAKSGGISDPKTLQSRLVDACLEMYFHGCISAFYLQSESFVEQPMGWQMQIFEFVNVLKKKTADFPVGEVRTPGHENCCFSRICDVDRSLALEISRSFHCWIGTSLGVGSGRSYPPLKIEELKKDDAAEREYLVPAGHRSVRGKFSIERNTSGIHKRSGSETISVTGAPGIVLCNEFPLSVHSSHFAAGSDLAILFGEDEKVIKQNGTTLAFEDRVHHHAVVSIKQSKEVSIEISFNEKWPIKLVLDGGESLEIKNFKKIDAGDVFESNLSNFFGSRSHSCYLACENKKKRVFICPKDTLEPTHMLTPDDGTLVRLRRTEVPNNTPGRNASFSVRGKIIFDTDGIPDSDDWKAFSGNENGVLVEVFEDQRGEWKSPSFGDKMWSIGCVSFPKYRYAGVPLVFEAGEAGSLRLAGAPHLQLVPRQLARATFAEGKVCGKYFRPPFNAERALLVRDTRSPDAYLILCPSEAEEVSVISFRCRDIYSLSGIYHCDSPEGYLELAGHALRAVELEAVAKPIGQVQVRSGSFLSENAQTRIDELRNILSTLNVSGAHSRIHKVIICMLDFHTIANCDSRHLQNLDDGEFLRIIQRLNAYVGEQKIISEVGELRPLAPNFRIAASRLLFMHRSLTEELERRLNALNDYDKIAESLDVTEKNIKEIANKETLAATVGSQNVAETWKWDALIEQAAETQNEQWKLLQKTIEGKNLEKEIADLFSELDAQRAIVEIALNRLDNVYGQKQCVRNLRVEDAVDALHAIHTDRGELRPHLGSFWSHLKGLNWELESSEIEAIFEKLVKFLAIRARLNYAEALKNYKSSHGGIVLDLNNMPRELSLSNPDDSPIVEQRLEPNFVLTWLLLNAIGDRRLTNQQAKSIRTITQSTEVAELAAWPTGSGKSSDGIPTIVTILSKQRRSPYILIPVRQMASSSGDLGVAMKLRNVHLVNLPALAGIDGGEPQKLEAFTRDPEILQRIFENIPSPEAETQWAVLLTDEMYARMAEALSSAVRSHCICDTNASPREEKCLELLVQIFSRFSHRSSAWLLDEVSRIVDPSSSLICPLAGRGAIPPPNFLTRIVGELYLPLWNQSAALENFQNGDLKRALAEQLRAAGELCNFKGDGQVAIPAEELVEKILKPLATFLLHSLEMRSDGLLLVQGNTVSLGGREFTKSEFISYLSGEIEVGTEIGKFLRRLQSDKVHYIDLIEQLAIVRGMLGEVMPQAFAKKMFDSYGPSEDGSRAVVAYKSGMPTAAEPSFLPIKAALFFQSIARNGLTKGMVLEVVKSYWASAKAEAEAKHLPIDDTREGKRFAKLLASLPIGRDFKDKFGCTQVLLSSAARHLVECPNDEYFRGLKKALDDSAPLTMTIANEVAPGQLSQPNQFSETRVGTTLSFFAQFAVFFTATPLRPSAFPARFAGTIARGRTEDNVSIVRPSDLVEKFQETDTLETLVGRAFSERAENERKLGALIDQSGKIFADHHNDGEAVAIHLRKIFQDAGRKPIPDIIFPSKKPNHWQILSGSTGQLLEPFEGGADTLQARGIYLDADNTTVIYSKSLALGSNFFWSGHAILTTDTKVDSSSALLQARGRARDGQPIAFFAQNCTEDDSSTPSLSEKLEASAAEIEKQANLRHLRQEAFSAVQQVGKLCILTRVMAVIANDRESPRSIADRVGNFRDLIKEADRFFSFEDIRGFSSLYLGNVEVKEILCAFDILVKKKREGLEEILEKAATANSVCFTAEVVSDMLVVFDREVKSIRNNVELEVSERSLGPINVNFHGETEIHDGDAVLVSMQTKEQEQEQEQETETEYEADAKLFSWRIDDLRTDWNPSEINGSIDATDYFEGDGGHYGNTLQERIFDQKRSMPWVEVERAIAEKITGEHGIASRYETNYIPIFSHFPDMRVTADFVCQHNVALPIFHPLRPVPRHAIQYVKGGKTVTILVSDREAVFYREQIEKENLCNCVLFTLPKAWPLSRHPAQAVHGENLKVGLPILCAALFAGRADWLISNEDSCAAFSSLAEELGGDLGKLQSCILLSAICKSPEREMETSVKRQKDLIGKNGVFTGGFFLSEEVCTKIKGIYPNFSLQELQIIPGREDDQVELAACIFAGNEWLRKIPTIHLRRILSAALRSRNQNVLEMAEQALSDGEISDRLKRVTQKTQSVDRNGMLLFRKLYAPESSPKSFSKKGKSKEEILKRVKLLKELSGPAFASIGFGSEALREIVQEGNLTEEVVQNLGSCNEEFSILLAQSANGDQLRWFTVTQLTTFPEIVAILVMRLEEGRPENKKALSEMVKSFSVDAMLNLIRSNSKWKKIFTLLDEEDYKKIADDTNSENASKLLAYLFESKEHIWRFETLQQDRKAEIAIRVNVANCDAEVLDAFFEQIKGNLTPHQFANSLGKHIHFKDVNEDAMQQFDCLIENYRSGTSISQGALELFHKLGTTDEWDSNCFTNRQLIMFADDAANGNSFLTNKATVVNWTEKVFTTLTEERAMRFFESVLDMKAEDMRSNNFDFILWVFSRHCTRLSDSFLTGIAKTLLKQLHIDHINENSVPMWAGGKFTKSGILDFARQLSDRLQPSPTLANALTVAATNDPDFLTLPKNEQADILQNLEKFLEGENEEEKLNKGRYIILSTGFHSAFTAILSKEWESKHTSVRPTVERLPAQPSPKQAAGRTLAQPPIKPVAGRTLAQPPIKPVAVAGNGGAIALAKWLLGVDGVKFTADLFFSYCLHVDSDFSKGCGLGILKLNFTKSNEMSEEVCGILENVSTKVAIKEIPGGHPLIDHIIARGNASLLSGLTDEQIAESTESLWGVKEDSGNLSTVNLLTFLGNLGANVLAPAFEKLMAANRKNVSVAIVCCNILSAKVAGNDQLRDLLRNKEIANLFTKSLIGKLGNDYLKLVIDLLGRDQITAIEPEKIENLSFAPVDAEMIDEDNAPLLRRYVLTANAEKMERLSSEQISKIRNEDISEIAASQERFHSILGPKELLIKFVLNESACRQLCKEQLRVLPEGEAGIELIKKIDKEKLLEKMQLWVESDAASGLSDEYLEAIFAILTDGKDVECNELPKSLLKLFPSDKEHSKKLIEKLKEHTSAKKVSFAFSEWAMEQSPDDEGFWADIQIQRVLRGELGVDIILGSSKIKSFLLKSESTRNGILTFLFGDKGCGDATMYSLLNLLLMDSNLASASHENLESIFAKLNYGYDYAKTVVRWAIGSEENAEKFISKDVIAGYISYVPIEFEDAMFKYLTSEDRMENFEPYYIDKIIANSTVLQDYISDKQLRSLAMASRQSSSRYKSSLENLSDKRLHAIKLSDENEALLRAFPSEKLSLNQILFLDKKQSSNSGDGSNLPTQLTISTGCVLQLKNELTDYLTSSIGGAKTGQATNVDSPKAARGEVGSIPADGISKKVNEEVTGQNVVEDVGQKIKLLQEAAKNPSTREEASSVLNELHKMSADSAPNRLKWLTISAGILSALSCGAAIALGFLGFLSTAWVVILPAIGGLLLLTLGLGIAYAVKRKQFQNSSLGKLGGLIG